MQRTHTQKNLFFSQSALLIKDYSSEQQLNTCEHTGRIVTSSAEPFFPQTQFTLGHILCREVGCSEDGVRFSRKGDRKRAKVWRNHEEDYHPS